MLTIKPGPDVSMRLDSPSGIHPTFDGVLNRRWKVYQDMNPILTFDGAYRFLSNFHGSPLCPYGIAYKDNDVFSSPWVKNNWPNIAPTVEHAYQAAKTTDWFMALKILQADTPGQAKRMGAKVELRPDWEEIKLKVMYMNVRRKFEGYNNRALKAQLIETGQSDLFEGNTWGDKFWGRDAETLEGENHLGKILMFLRKEYSSGKCRPFMNHEHLCGPPVYGDPDGVYCACGCSAFDEYCLTSEIDIYDFI